MRRLIPYIASDYRKDRIWMRRTKRERRNYEICIAVDDSASMRDVFTTEVCVILTSTPLNLTLNPVWVIGHLPESMPD